MSACVGLLLWVRACMCVAWAVDKDEDGELSIPENRALIRDYLKSSRDWLPRLLEETMAVGCEIGIQMAGKSLRVGGNLGWSSHDAVRWLG